VTALELSPRWSGYEDRSDATERWRARVLTELGTEMAPEHELFGRVAHVEAFFEASDDVLVRLREVTEQQREPCSDVPRPDGPRSGDAAPSLVDLLRADDDIEFEPPRAPVRPRGWEV